MAPKNFVISLAFVLLGVVPTPSPSPPPPTHAPAFDAVCAKRNLGTWIAGPFADVSGKLILKCQKATLVVDPTDWTIVGA